MLARGKVLVALFYIYTCIGLLSLSACTAIPGVTAGILVTSATSNPAAGLAVATMANAVVDSGIKYIQRKFSTIEQQQIADAIGQTEPNHERKWEVKHAIPYSNNKGRIVVISENANALTICKEALFSVEEEKDKQTVERWYTLNVCKNGNNWQWAQAEPATSRWGALQ